MCVQMFMSQYINICSVPDALCTSIHVFIMSGVYWTFDLDISFSRRTTSLSVTP